MLFYVKKSLKNVKSPSLIIHSKADRVSIRENVEIIKTNINSNKIKTLDIKHAHHNIFDENKDSELILSEIDKFLELYIR